MAPTIPDPIPAARAMAQTINANREYALKTPIDRVIADSPFLDRESFVAGLADFHAERMAKRPSVAKYPESTPWVDYAVRYDAELSRAANLTPFELAVVQSLHRYTSFRGFAGAKAVPVDEKCRVAFVPDTSLGRLHIKNVDDPLFHWKPRTDRPSYRNYDLDLSSDGVGNGLHMDTEPEDLFPLPVLTMLRQYANDVPSGVEFLRRYSPFWGSANLLLHDRKHRSAAIEKCSYNFFEVFYPGPDGRSHISGMTCRDPQSPQGKHQAAMRKKYVEKFALGDDCADNAFWGACAKFEGKLSGLLSSLGEKPDAQRVIELFTDAYPKGLNKAGLRLHPKQGLVGYTLITVAVLLDQKEVRRWQRSEDGKSWPTEPELYRD